MAQIQRYLKGNGPLWAAMTGTTLFQDLSIGDTTTGNGDTETIALPAVCASYSGTGWFTGALYNNGVDIAVSGWSVACKLQYVGPAVVRCALPPEYDPPAPSGMAYFDTSPDAIVWTNRDSVALSALSSGPVPGGTSYGPQNVIARRSIAAVTCKYARVRISNTYEWYEKDDLTLGAYISDFRIYSGVWYQPPVCDCGGCC